MGIRFQCEHCDKRLNVKAKQAGELCLCPACGKEIQIPAQSDSATSEKLRARSRLKAPKLQKRTAVSSAHSVELRPVTRRPESSQLVAKPTVVETAPSASKTNTTLEDRSQKEQQSTESFLLSKPETKIESDPLNTSENHVWYFRHKRLGEKGPLKGAEIEPLLDSGKLCPGFIVWREDWNDWIAIEKVFPDRFGKASLAKTEANAISGKMVRKNKSGIAVFAGLGVAAFLIITVLVYLIVTFR